MNVKKDKWSKFLLNECCSFIRGVTYSNKDEVNINGHGILRANNIDLDNKINFNDIKLISTTLSIKEEKKLKKNDIFICTASGSVDHIGKVAFIDSDTDYYAGGFMGIIRAKSNIVIPYLLYSIFLSPAFVKRIKSQRAGTNIQNLKFSDIDKNEVYLPPIEEQKQIVSLFQSLESAFEKIEEQEKDLLTLKKNLLKDLFSNRKLGKYLNGNDFENVKFEKIAFSISERVEPQKTELDIYVGLEHLDSDNLVIERTGKPSDVIGTKLKIYKGDIIFGKRRAYQRKVAVSHFDGIASAHGMILRANQENIEKDFLPFFMQSDEFMNRAVQISEGSLSPTIKWKTIASQVFILPKKEKQNKLIEIFKQFDSTIQQLKQQKENLNKLKQNLLNEIFG